MTLARKIQAGESGQLANFLHWPVEGFVLVGSGGRVRGPRYKVLKNGPRTHDLSFACAIIENN